MEDKVSQLLSSIGRFSGASSADPINVWLFRLEVMAAAIGIDDLKAAALQLISSKVHAVLSTNGMLGQSWADIRAFLFNFYGPTDPQAELLEALQALQQGSLTVSAYADLYLSHVAKIDDATADDWRVNFLQSLSSPIREKIQSVKMETFLEVVRAAKLAEAALLKQAKSARPSPTALSGAKETTASTSASATTLTSKSSATEAMKSPISLPLGMKGETTPKLSLAASSQIMNGSSISNLPPSISRLIIREDSVEQINKALTSDGKVVVCGELGVGKTQIVLQYGRKFTGTKYQIVWWLSAATPIALLMSYRQLAQSLSLSSTLDQNDDIDNNGEEIPRLSKQILSAIPKTNWLFIFDNVVDQSVYESLFPSLFSFTSTVDVSRHVIVVSRSNAWKLGCSIVSVPLLTKDLSSRLIRKFFPETSDGEHVPFHAASKGHPLALTLLLHVAYIKLSKKFRECGSAINTSAVDSSLIGTSHSLGFSIRIFAQTVATEILRPRRHDDDVKLTEKPSQSTAVCGSSSSPSSSSSLVSGKVAKLMDEELYEEALELLTEAVSRAVNEKGSAEELSSLHLELGDVNHKLGLVDVALHHYQSTIDTLNGAPRTYHHVATAASAYNELAGACMLQGEWKRCHSLCHEALSLLAQPLLHSETTNIDLPEINNHLQRTASFHMLLGACERHSGNLEEAINHFSVAATIHQRNNTKTEDLAYILFVLGESEVEYGRLEDAENHLKIVLDIRQQLVGNDHEQYIVVVNSMARVLALQEKYHEADPLIEIALNYHRKCLTNAQETKDNLARSLDSAGEIKLKCGQLDAAQRLFEEALELVQSQTKVDTEHVGELYHKIGVCLLNKQDLGAAINFFSKALPIMERTMGNDDDGVAFLRTILSSATSLTIPQLRH